MFFTKNHLFSLYDLFQKQHWAYLEKAAWACPAPSRMPPAEGFWLFSHSMPRSWRPPYPDGTPSQFRVCWEPPNISATLTRPARLLVCPCKWPLCWLGFSEHHRILRGTAVTQHPRGAPAVTCNVTSTPALHLSNSFLWKQVIPILGDKWNKVHLYLHLHMTNTEVEDVPQIRLLTEPSQCIREGLTSPSK